MEYTVEANKNRQKDVGVIRYTDKQNVKVYIWIYKLNKLPDSKSLTFENRERALIHIENLIKTTTYDLISFTNEPKSEGFPERYFIGLRK